MTQTGYTQPEYGGQQRYGSAEYSQTTYAQGGGRESYQRYEQEGSYGSGGAFGQSVTQETRPTYGGGYEQTTERRYERPSGEWQSEVRVEGRQSGSGGYYEETKRYSGKNNSDSDDTDDEYKKQKKREKKERKKVST